MLINKDLYSVELSPFFIKCHNQKERCIVRDEYHGYCLCLLLFTRSHAAYICLTICVSKINPVVFQTPNIVNNESSFFCFCGDNSTLQLHRPRLPCPSPPPHLLTYNISCVVGWPLGTFYTLSHSVLTIVSHIDAILSTLQMCKRRHREGKSPALHIASQPWGHQQTYVILVTF